MEQSELGKNEDNNEEASSAGLSDSETATTPDNGAEDMPSEADDATEVDTPVAEASDDGDTEVADETDDEADEDAGEEPVAGADSDEDEADEETTEDDDDDDDDEDSVAASDDRDDDEEGEDEVNGLRRGDVVEGTIISTDTSEIIIDLGEDREGIVPRREIELLNARTLEKLQEGADIHVYIVNPSNHEGQTILSINHAQEELDWQRAEEYMNDKTVYDGKIGGYNKGGLIVRFGRLRGFVPQSQISDKRMLDVEGDTPEERFSDLVGNNISVKVMEVDRSRNRLILSERAAMREVRQRRKEALITELKEGEIRDGRVVSLENFGAFVDIGGAEGLVHITELSWKHVTHPRQVLDVGQEVRVKVISVDENRNRIGLSIKQLKADPWDEIAAELRTGSLIRATVTKLTKFGAFARVESKQAVEGLIHISELDDSRVEHPRDVVSKGDKLTLRVVKVDVKNRRLGLSLRRVNSPEFLDEDLKRAYEEQEARVDEEPDDEPDTEEAEAADDTPEDEVVAEGTGAEEVEDEVEDAIEKADTDDDTDDVEVDDDDSDDDNDESDDDDDESDDEDDEPDDDDDEPDDDDDESDDDESDEDDD